MAAGPGKRFAAERLVRMARRRRLAVSFTRVLAHKPMFTAPYGKAREGSKRDADQLDRAAEWDDAIRAWRRHWARARKNSTTLVRDGRNRLVLRG